nr:SPOR domain-containing protein [Marinibactrum halimedae]
MAESGLPKAWVIQVASFSEANRANAMVKKLQADRYKAYSRVYSTNKGSLHRVFVGPNIDKRSAEKVKQKLDKQLSIDALVMRYQP